MAYLKHRLDGKVVSLYELSGKVIIGRSQSCNICLDDGTVSARHAQVFLDDNAWQVEDLGSTNGLIVGGEKVVEITLEHEAVFSIGTHQFEFLSITNDGLDKTLKIKKSWIPGVFYTQ